ncbi:MAG: hypothetical protein ACK2T2_15525 [Anaerolineales bacterium]|jgi:hypothetical protein
MKLSPPKQASWTLALLLGLLGIVAHQVSIPFASQFDFWLVAFAFLLLLFATLLRGL